VEATTNLGAARNEVSAVQHHDADLLLYRKVLRPVVGPKSLIVLENFGDCDHVVEKEKPVQRN
jgi:hypothetical protein